MSCGKYTFHVVSEYFVSLSWLLNIRSIFLSILLCHNTGCQGLGPRSWKINKARIQQPVWLFLQDNKKGDLMSHLCHGLICNSYRNYCAILNFKFGECQVLVEKNSHEKNSRTCSTSCVWVFHFEFDSGINLSEQRRELTHIL